MTDRRIRVLVLVLSIDREPWRSIELNGQRATWANAQEWHKGLEVLYYYGQTSGLRFWASRLAAALVRRLGWPKVLRAVVQTCSRRSARREATQIGDRITTDAPEAYAFITAKMVQALRYAFQRHDFDFVFRTNTSSYVRLDRLSDYVQSLRPKDFYGGFPGDSRYGEFASGAGMLISRDVINAALDDGSWAYELMDDVAMGLMMHKLGVPLTPLPRLDVTEGGLALLDDESLESHFHFRCKNEHRALDSVLMVTLHQRLKRPGA